MTKDDEKRIRNNFNEAPTIKWNFPWEDVALLLAEIDRLRDKNGNQEQMILELRSDRDALPTVLGLICSQQPGAAANAVREDYPEIALIIDAAFAARDERILELEQQLRAMKECSDGNFASYERVKAQLSDCVTSHQKRNAELAEYERAFCDAHQPDDEPTDIECSRCLAVHLEQQLKTAQEWLAEAEVTLERVRAFHGLGLNGRTVIEEHFAKHSPSSGKEQE